MCASSNHKPLSSSNSKNNDWEKRTYCIPVPEKTRFVEDFENNACGRWRTCSSGSSSPLMARQKSRSNNLKAEWLLASCHKWTWTPGPWGQKDLQFSYVLGPSPNELWPLLHWEKSVALSWDHNQNACLEMQNGIYLPNWRQGRMRKGKGAGCTNFIDSWNKELALLFPQLKILVALNLFFCDLWQKNEFISVFH